MAKHVAMYLRVSTRHQDTKSQEPDMQRYADSLDDPVKWYTDKVTGKTMDRPEWSKVEEAIRLRKVSTVVVWRLDRLGRTASGLTKLFDELQVAKVNLVSLKDGLDLSTPAGRLMANVLASVAQYETEVRGERVAAGIAKARANGVKWGQGKTAKRKLTPTVLKCIRTMFDEGENISAIARALGVSRPSVYEAKRLLKID